MMEIDEMPSSIPVWMIRTPAPGAHRDEALVAHAAAARSIMRDNNADRDPFELDLHGLHVSEATQFLDERLEGVSVLIRFRTEA